MRMDGRTDRHDKANSCSSQFENAPRTSKSMSLGKQISISKNQYKYTLNTERKFLSVEPGITQVTTRFRRFNLYAHSL
jgi:hypothetical protein